MARARNIKPAFFMNEKLADCPPLARLLFAGLWTIADREGRLENRPKKIKVELLPYDDCNIEQLLDKLAENGFIVKYSVDGANYIQISKFTKHQNPHKKEIDSVIPSYKAQFRSDPAPAQTGTSPALTLNPLTDSLIPLTDTIPPISPKVEAQAPLPSWVPLDAWNGFIEMRKKIRKPLTKRGVALTISALQKLHIAGHDPAAVLDQSTQRNWSGVFEIREGNGNAGFNQNEQQAGNSGFQGTGKNINGRSKGYSIEDALNQALADKTRRPEGREERLANLGISPD